MFRDNLTRTGGRLALCVFVAVALSAAPAGAVVGPSESGARFADHLVMVLARGGDREGFCTGVVLGPRAVLTAAHCLRPTHDMAVVYRDAAGKPVLVAVAATASHPLYRPNAIVERHVSIDLALIETATPLDPRFTAAPLAAGDGPPVGSDAIVAGYGVGREGAPSSGGTLRSARLKVRAPLSSILLWADDATGGAGACGGDFGRAAVSRRWRDRGGHRRLDLGRRTRQTLRRPDPGSIDRPAARLDRCDFGALGAVAGTGRA